MGRECNKLMVQQRKEHIECEHGPCKEVTHFEQSHSMLVVLQKVDSTKGYTYFQCELGSEINYCTSQHWHCSHEHMQKGVTDCISNHYKEHLLHEPIAGTTNLHKIVLGSELECKACSNPLVSEAYRFSLTMATPYNAIPDNSYSELGDWCCSLSCATNSALSLIATLEAITQ